MTEPLTDINRKDFELFPVEFVELNEKITERMIQSFMIFKIRLLKLFKFKNLQEVEKDLATFEGYFTNNG